MNILTDFAELLLCLFRFNFQFSYKDTAQKMKFSIKDFFSECDQIRRKLRIWSHLLKNYLMESFIFCAVTNTRGVIRKPLSIFSKAPFQMFDWFSSKIVPSIMFTYLANIFQSIITKVEREHGL